MFVDLKLFMNLKLFTNFKVLTKNENVHEFRKNENKKTRKKNKKMRKKLFVLVKITGRKCSDLFF